MVGSIEEVVEKKADGWIIMAKTFNFEIITPVRVVYTESSRAFLLMGLKDR